MNWWNKNILTFTLFIIGLVTTSTVYSNDPFEDIKFSNGVDNSKSSSSIQVPYYDCNEASELYVDFDTSYHYFKHIFSHGAYVGKEAGENIKFIKDKDGIVTEVEIVMMSNCSEYVVPELITNNKAGEFRTGDSSKYFLTLRKLNGARSPNFDNCINKMKQKREAISLKKVRLKFDQTLMPINNTPIFLPEQDPNPEAGDVCLKVRKEAADKFKPYYSSEGVVNEEVGLQILPGQTENIEYQTLSPGCSNNQLLGENSPIRNLYEQVQNEIIDPMVRDKAREHIGDLADTHKDMEAWVNFESTASEKFQTNDKVKNIDALIGSTAKMYKMFEKDLDNLLSKIADAVNENKQKEAEELLDEFKKNYGDQVNWEEIKERFKDVVASLDNPDDEQDTNAFSTYLYKEHEGLSETRNMLMKMSHVMEQLEDFKVEDYGAQPRKIRKWNSEIKKYAKAEEKVSKKLARYEDFRQELKDLQVYADSLHASFDQKHADNDSAINDSIEEASSGSSAELLEKAKSELNDWGFCAHGLRLEEYRKIEHEAPHSDGRLSLKEQLDSEIIQLESEISEVESLLNGGSFGKAKRRLKRMHKKYLSGLEKRKTCGEEENAFGKYVDNLDEVRAHEEQMESLAAYQQQQQAQMMAQQFSSLFGQTGQTYNPNSMFNSFGMNSQTPNYYGFQPPGQPSFNPYATGFGLNQSPYFSPYQIGAMSFGMPQFSSFSPYASPMFMQNPAYANGFNYMNMGYMQQPPISGNFMNMNFMPGAPGFNMSPLANQPNMFQNPGVMSLDPMRIPAAVGP